MLLKIKLIYQCPKGLGHRLRGSANAVRIRAPQIGGKEVLNNIIFLIIYVREDLLHFHSIELSLKFKSSIKPDLLSCSFLFVLQVALLYGEGSSPQ